MLPCHMLEYSLAMGLNRYVTLCNYTLHAAVILIMLPHVGIFPGNGTQPVRYPTVYIYTILCMQQHCLM